MKNPKFEIGQTVWGIRSRGRAWPHLMYEIHGGEIEFTFFSSYFGYKIKNGDGLLFSEDEIFTDFETARAQQEKLNKIAEEARSL